MYGLSKMDEAAARTRKRSAVALQIMDFVSERGETGSTCDEFVVEKAMDRGLVTPRFTELHQAGCIKTMGLKRPTKYGGKASVYMVSPEADFHNFLRGVSTASLREGKDSEESKMESYALAGKRFVSAWKKAKTKGQKSSALERLVRSLTEIDSGPA